MYLFVLFGISDHCCYQLEVFACLISSISVAFVLSVSCPYEILVFLPLALWQN